jgi:hypothetical protein
LKSGLQSWALAAACVAHRTPPSTHLPSADVHALPAGDDGVHADTIAATTETSSRVDPNRMLASVACSNGASRLHRRATHRTRASASPARFALGSASGSMTKVSRIRATGQR